MGLRATRRSLLRVRWLASRVIAPEFKISRREGAVMTVLWRGRGDRGAGAELCVMVGGRWTEPRAM